MKDSIGDQVKNYKEFVEPDQVVSERILHEFANRVTQESDVRLLNKQRKFFALFNISTIFAMMQSQGIKLALAAFLTVTTVGGVVAVSNHANQNQHTDVPKVAQIQVSPTPTQLAEINTEADIEVVAKAVDQSVAELDKIEKDLNSLDVSLSTQDLDKAMKQLDDIQ